MTECGQKNEMQESKYKRCWGNYVPAWKRQKGRNRRGARSSVGTEEHSEWFITPVGSPCEISSSFGPRQHPMGGGNSGHFHLGVDIAANTGSPVVAAAPGTVVTAAWRGALGNLVEVVHDGGFVTRYAHNKELYALPGKKVKQGELIACVGSTGRSTGPHLHFEVRKDGVPLDPCAFGACDLVEQVQG